MKPLQRLLTYHAKENTLIAEGNIEYRSYIDILAMEEKLCRKVANRDLVHVSNSYRSILATPKSHHGNVLEKFTPNSPCTDNEPMLLLQCLLEIPPKHGSLASIPILLLNINTTLDIKSTQR